MVNLEKGKVMAKTKDWDFKVKWNDHGKNESF